jgi:predicted DCC family thiol-disulfide oxidoreductase YuxK
MAEEEPVIIAYDGECMMCSRGIRFLAEHDHRRRLRFVTLQSRIGREMEYEATDTALSTVVVKKDGRSLTHSDAILHILKPMGGPWAILGGLGLVLPRGMRDAIYRFIARNRYRWFGKADLCSLPSDALRERLIDGDRV